MKKITRKIGYTLSLLTLCLMAGITTFAQSADTLSSADYHVTMPKHYNAMYNGPLRFIIMGVVLAAIIFVTYRYYKEASIGKDIWHDPQ